MHEALPRIVHAVHRRTHDTEDEGAQGSWQNSLEALRRALGAFDQVLAVIERPVENVDSEIQELIDRRTQAREAQTAPRSFR